MSYVALSHVATGDLATAALQNTLIDDIAFLALNANLAGTTFFFGGSSNVGTLATAFPAGTTQDNAAPNTGRWNVDAANIPAGTYLLEAMLACEGGGTCSLELVNLTDAPTVALGSVITSTSATGVLVQSAAITFPAGGSLKGYIVKLKSSSAALHAWAWSIRIVRTV